MGFRGHALKQNNFSLLWNILQSYHWFTFNRSLIIITTVTITTHYKSFAPSVFTMALKYYDWSLWPGLDKKISLVDQSLKKIAKTELKVILQYQIHQSLKNLKSVCWQKKWWVLYPSPSDISTVILQGHRVNQHLRYLLF